jgi:hypothetical protein
MIELGVSVRKLRNFSISWNRSAQRALSLDRIGTGSNLIERQLRWLKGQHECRLRTRRTEDCSCSPLTNTSLRPYSTYWSKLGNRDENTFLKTFTSNVSKSCYFLDRTSRYNAETPHSRTLRIKKKIDLNKYKEILTEEKIFIFNLSS